MIYATATDYGEPAPQNVERLLQSASNLVLRSTRTAIYATDLDGYPRDVKLRDAMRDATVAQVRAWDAAGLDPTTPVGTRPRVAQSKSISGASITYADAEAHAATSEGLLTQLAPEAYSILDAAGLIGRQPVVYG